MGVYFSFLGSRECGGGGGWLMIFVSSGMIVDGILDRRIIF